MADSLEHGLDLGEGGLPTVVDVDELGLEVVAGVEAVLARQLAVEVVDLVELRQVVVHLRPQPLQLGLDGLQALVGDPRGVRVELAHELGDGGAELLGLRVRRVELGPVGVEALEPGLLLPDPRAHGLPPALQAGQRGAERLEAAAAGE